MDYTIGDQDVRHNDLDAVGENGTILDGNLNHTAGQGLEGVTILQCRAVTDGSRYHCASLISLPSFDATPWGSPTMSLQDGRHPSSIELSECSGSRLEGSVTRSENSQVRGLIHRGRQAGSDQQIINGSQSQSRGGSRDSCRNGQNLIDDVDYAASELEVLFSLSTSSCYTVQTFRPREYILP